MTKYYRIILSVLFLLSSYEIYASGQFNLDSKIIGDVPQEISSRTSVPENMVSAKGGNFLFEGKNVTISGFFISKYEVTVGDFRRFIEETKYNPTGNLYGYDVYEIMDGKHRYKKVDAPSWDNPGHDLPQEEDHPVVMVSWIDALEYCNWLSRQENLIPVYTILVEKNKYDVTWNRNSNGYRLPTEAEWDYACKVGTTGTFYYGDTADINTGWYQENSEGSTHPVGLFAPNSLGLYDLYGNAGEWVWDRYQRDSVAISEINPTGPTRGTPRVSKGVDFTISYTYEHFKFAWNPCGMGYNVIGFRVVRN